MMRLVNKTNITSIAILCSITLVPLTGCQSTGMSVPSLAFWKTENSQWAKNDSVPPPATHFDPEPSTSEGFTPDINMNREALAQKKSPAADSKFDSSDSKSLVSADKGSPMRQPYRFNASEDLSKKQDDNAFQPGGKLTHELPDFGLPPKSGMATIETPATPPKSGNDFAAPSGSEHAMSPKSPLVNSGGTNDFQLPDAKFSLPQVNPIPTPPPFGTAPESGAIARKMENQYPGLANQFKSENEKEFGRIETPNLNNPLAHNGGSAFSPDAIKTPKRETITPPASGLGGSSFPTNKLGPLVGGTPNHPSTPTQPGQRLLPDNRLRDPNGQMADSGSTYPSTPFIGFGQPKAPAGNLTPIAPPTGMTSQPTPLPGQDVILPESLRHANLNFAPGSINQKLLPVTDTRVSPLELR